MSTPSSTALHEVQARSNSNFLERNILIIANGMAWILFGSILIIHPALTWSIDIPYQFWYRQALLLLSLMGVSLINTRILVAHYLIHNRFITYTLFICLLFLIMQVVTQSFDYVTLFPQVMSKAFGKQGHPFRIHLDIFILIMSITIVGISTSVTLIGHYRTNLHLREQAEKLHINAELTFLRTQINPHFFFNTLNTVYSLTFINVDHARDSLIKLSRMMRYSLNQNEQERPFVSTELDFIRDYVELMKLRTSEPSYVVLHISQLKNDATVAPMLLLPFVENAFKYGIGNEKGEIKIIVLQTEKYLSLHVINPIQRTEENLDKGGIGIVNTQRRLELLYPSRYSLRYGKDERKGVYIVDLAIEL